MKRISSLICLWSLAGILATEIQAQLWGPQTGGVVYEISPNGRYVTGLTQSSGGSGFVWDVQSADVEILGQGVYPYGITNNKLIAGGDGYREPGASEWSSLGAGTWVRQVTPDGQTIVGYAEKLLGDYVSTVPYSWSRNEAGGWTGTEWAHPDNIKQGCIYDVSDNGQTAVGYIHPGTNKIAILWKSPDSYELPFSLDAYSEYFCISANGKYAGFSYNDGNANAWAGIHNLETGEITFIPEGIRVNAVDNNGFIFGVYRPNDVDRAFIWNRKLGFMDFGDFIVTYASEEELEFIKSTSLERALTNKAVTFSINAVTPDGWTFALCLQSGYDGEVYVLKIAPVDVYPYPQNLTTNVPPADRNKVILTWDAPEPDNETPTGYDIYRKGQRIATVGAATLTYTDDNVSPPGYYNYQVTALYGDKQSNFSNTAQAVIINNYDLPLRENFDKLNLTANYWTAETSPKTASMEWKVYSDAGVENGTGLMLTVNNMVYNSNQEFSASLTSKYLDGTNASAIFLSFLAKPDYYLETTLTPDTLSIDVHDGKEWKNVDKYTFKLSMEWKADILDISEAAAGNLFRLRFRVTGANRTVSAKYIHLDDIVVATSPPTGNAIPENILSEKTGDSIRLAWKNPQTGAYALTYAYSPKRFSIGNDGKNFIAANRFDPAGLNIYQGKYLTSITAYVNRKKSSPTVATELKLAVFIDGQRLVDKAIDSFTPNAWNTFPLDNPIALNGQDLIFGIEVTAHDAQEEPIGVDGTRRPVIGKGDLYSEDGGKTWNTLSESGKVNNWSIIGNLSGNEIIEPIPATDIVGYNVYACGVKLNDDLVFGQSFVTGVSEEPYTIRAYSLATGLSEESESAQNVGIAPFPKTQFFPEIYPNPVKDILFIRSETPVKSLAVYDLSGRICKQAGPGATTLSLKNLNSGLYLIKIKTAAGEFVRMIFR
jgi:hypothetical protein